MTSLSTNLPLGSGLNGRWKAGNKIFVIVSPRLVIGELKIVVSRVKHFT